MVCTLSAKADAPANNATAVSDTESADLMTRENMARLLLISFENQRANGYTTSIIRTMDANGDCLRLPCLLPRVALWLFFFCAGLSPALRSIYANDKQCG